MSRQTTLIYRITSFSCIPYRRVGRGDFTTVLSELVTVARWGHMLGSRGLLRTS